MALHYYPLINRLLKQFSIREDLSSLYASEETAFQKPFITIAREPGSGGAPIAKAVAARLGWEYIDEQIIDEIAKSTKKRTEIIKSIDEKKRTVIQDMVHSLLNEDYVDDLKYVTELVKVVLAHASQGHVVILGRGANFITPFAKGLHVNITAPYSVRVKRAMDFEGHNKEKAKQVIADVEKERRNFIKQYFKQDVDKKNSYDLTINTTYFRVQEARDVILEAFYKKFSASVRYKAFLKS